MARRRTRGRSQRARTGRSRRGPGPGRDPLGCGLDQGAWVAVSTRGLASRPVSRQAGGLDPRWLKRMLPRFGAIPHFIAGRPQARRGNSRPRAHRRRRRLSRGRRPGTKACSRLWRSVLPLRDPKARKGAATPIPPHFLVHAMRPRGVADVSRVKLPGRPPARPQRTYRTPSAHILKRVEGLGRSIERYEPAQPVMALEAGGSSRAAGTRLDGPLVGGSRGRPD